MLPEVTRLVSGGGREGLLRSSDGKEPAGNSGDPGVILGREDHLEKGMATHSNILV